MQYDIATRHGFSIHTCIYVHVHMYTDDTLIYIEFNMTRHSVAVEAWPSVADIRTCVYGNKLQLNEDKLSLL